MALAVGFCCAPLSSPSAQPPPAPTAAQASWAVNTATALKLTTDQRTAFDAYFAALRDTTGEQPSMTNDQIRAMTLPQRMSYLADRVAVDLRLSRADADAAARLYAVLTPQQRVQLDQLTAPAETGRLGVATDDATDASPPGKPNYQLPSHTNPDWLVMPRPEDLARVYPTRARNLNIGGEARLSCTADTNGYLADCEITSETPPDFGFGNAALEITGYMRMKPATNFGAPVSAPVVIPVSFKLPDH